MEFRILGPLEIRAGEVIAEVPASGQRLVLALLLLEAGKVVSTDVLVDRLWEAGPPPTARKALQGRISSLRKQLQPLAGDQELIVSHPRGYALDLRPHQLDLERFEALMTEGRAAVAMGRNEEASEKLDAALELWRGPALADLAGEPSLRAHCARLDDLRMTVLEERIEADLALGRHRAVAGELEALVAAEPFRERLLGQLMVALHRCGRSADALAAYQRGRRALSEELGLEIGPALRQLQTSILRHDRTLELAAPAVPSTAGRAVVGRDAERTALLADVDTALGGRGALTLLAGEAGMGKSLLLEDLADAARQRGMRVLTGRCWEAGGAPAYWPWTQAIRQYLAGRDAADAIADLGAGAADLARIAPDVRPLVGHLPPPSSEDSEGGRFRAFEAYASFLRAGASRQPLMIVIDDLHAADPSSLLLLRFLARQLDVSPVMFAGAFRDTPGEITAALEDTVTDLLRESSTRVVRLRGLTEPEVGAILEMQSGERQAASLVAAVHDRSDGNPLFVLELARLLGEEDRRWQPGSSRSLPIPRSVRDIVSRRARGLSPECRAVLRAAAVLGREFGTALLQRVTGLSTAALADALDEAIRTGTVTEVRESARRLRFSHALVRDFFYEDLTAAERRRLHAAAGEQLERLHADHLEPHLAELAHHHLEGRSHEDVERAVRYARLAGDRAMSLLAFEEAARLYASGLDVLDTVDSPGERRCELLIALGEAESRAGRPDAARESFAAAATIARRLGADELLARAALGYGGRLVWIRSMGDERLLTLLEEGLDAVGPSDSPLRVGLLARLSGALRDRPDRHRSDPLSREAVERARRMGDPGILAHALEGRYAGLLGPGTAAQRLEVATEMATCGRAAHDRERAIHGHFGRIVALVDLGRAHECDSDVDAIDELAQELRQPVQLWLAAATKATLALLRGELEPAEQWIERAYAFGAGVRQADMEVAYRIQRYMLARARDRVPVMVPVLERSVGDFPSRPLFRALLVDAYAISGRLDDARRELGPAVAAHLDGLPPDNDWLPGLYHLAESMPALQATDVAAQLHSALRPYQNVTAANLVEIACGPVSRSLGLLSACTGDLREAVVHLEAAIDAGDRMRAKLCARRTRADLERVLDQVPDRG